jgi:WD40 repeat protein
VGGGVNVPFAWAPAQKIVYARGRAIWTSDEAGAHQTEVTGAPDNVVRVGWSPDAKRIWYATIKPGGIPGRIGEVDADGRNHRPIYEGKGPDLGFCCGFWSASEASFGFLASTEQLTDLLVWRDSWPWIYRSRPVSRSVLGIPQVAEFTSDSAHSRFLVLAGGAWHEGVFRFDRRNGQFTSYLDGISARDVDFSPDGQSAAYVDGYDGSLWRYDLRRRLKIPLAKSPFYAALPRWSPDGKWIAMTGRDREGGWRIYRLLARGGTPEQLIAGDENEGAPTWSPDGNSLIFGKVDCPLADECGIYRYNLATHFLGMLPGSQGFRTARWSPNGRYVAALRVADESLVVFDFSTKPWQKIYGPVRGDILAWSRESKSIYGYSATSDDPFIFRVAVPTGIGEKVADLKGVEPSGRNVISWFGLAPDDSPLVSGETGENELFSVTYQMP